MALPKNRRIKAEKDFEKIFKSGRAVRHPLFLLKFLNSSFPYCRAAVSVPVSVSKQATERNRLKRIFLAALEKVFPRCRSGIDLVIVASPAALEKKIDQITRSLEDIFLKANIVEAK